MDSKMNMFETVRDCIVEHFYNQYGFYPVEKAMGKSVSFSDFLIPNDWDKVENDTHILCFPQEPIENGSPLHSNCRPETIVYFTHGERTYIAVLYKKYDNSNMLDRNNPFFDGKDFLEEDDSFGIETRLVDVRCTSIEEFANKYRFAVNDTITVRLRYVENTEGIDFTRLDITPSMYIFPARVGYRLVCVNELIDFCPLEIEYSSINEDPVYIPMLRNIPTAASALYAMQTAKNSRVESCSRYFTLQQSGLVLNDDEPRPYYFSIIEGQGHVNEHCKFWTIKENRVLPQYLVMQLYDDYVLTTYKYKNNLISYGVDPFEYTYIYLPDVDDELSLYEQQRLYNEYRANEIQKLFVASGINIDMDGTLPHGSILQHGKYIIEDKIDNGGFGITYKATAKKISGRQSVVLKELFVKGFCTRKPLTNEVVCPDVNAKEFDRQKEKFIKEHKILVKLADKTKFVPRVGDTAFEENNTLYYEMQFVENGTLWSHRQRKDLTVQDILRIICHAGIALHCAHEMEFLHLDVTPLNIMVDDYNNGVLIDFGNSKHYSTQDEKFTTSGQVAKTNAFAPPELLTQQYHKFCMATDVYGLAITLYCMLTNDRFSTRCESDDVYLKHIKKKMEECEVTTPVADAIIKALHFDPKERQESVRAFLTELSAALDDTDLKAKIRELSVLPDFSFSDSIDVAVDNSVESEMDDDFI